MGARKSDIDRCFRAYHNKYNNNDNLPVFRMGSLNGKNFCLKEITLTTEKGENDEVEVYKREFQQKKTSLINMWMPMFHPSQTEKLIRDMVNTKCPESPEINQPGCPIENIRFNELVPDNDLRGGMYCDFNPKCQTVSSYEAETPSSGYLCFRTKDGRYTNYNFCCDQRVPHLTDIPFCGDLD